tara:strand:- start:397 stop:588 length:192 start_codon:yes stop_codon:yes gene_type:complete
MNGSTGATIWKSCKFLDEVASTAGDRGMVDVTNRSRTRGTILVRSDIGAADVPDMIHSWPFVW